MAAIAFGIPVGAVDTNVRRVLGRAVGGGVADVVDQPGWIQGAADASVDRDRPGDWTHALMDIGATICTPRSPDCPACPVRAWCVFAAEQRSGAASPARVADAPSRGRPRAIPFRATTRWLRGRIVDRLRAAPGTEWSTFDDGIGDHDITAVQSAVAALARDGVLERDLVDPERVRLATR